MSIERKIRIGLFTVESKLNESVRIDQIGSKTRTFLARLFSSIVISTLILYMLLVVYEQLMVNQVYMFLRRPFQPRFDWNRTVTAEI